MRGRTNVSGQGVVLNATTANCIVETGEQITAGDFVQTSYHPSLETNTIDNQTSQYTTYTPYTVELDNGNVLEMCVAESANGRPIYKIYSKSDLTLLASGEIDTYATMKNTKIANFGDNRIGLVTFKYYNNSVGTPTLYLYSYDSLTNQLTLDETIPIGGANVAYSTIDCVQLDSSTVIVWFSYKLYAIDIDNGTTITDKTISLENNVDVNQRRFQNGTMFVYDSQNKKFVLSSYLKVGTYQFSNNVFTELSTASYSSSIGEHFGFGRLSERVFYTFPLEERNSSGYYHNYAKVVIEFDDSISMVMLGGSTAYNSAKKILCPFDANTAMLFIVGGNKVKVAIISATSQDILPLPDEIYTYTGGTDYQEGAVGIQWLTATTFRLLFVKSSTSAIFALNCTVAPNEISVTPNVTYVKEYSTRCNGVAKQSGNAGDTIQVYIPIASS